MSLNTKVTVLDRDWIVIALGILAGRLRRVRNRDTLNPALSGHIYVTPPPTPPPIDHNGFSRAGPREPAGRAKVSVGVHGKVSAPPRRSFGWFRRGTSMSDSALKEAPHQVSHPSRSPLSSSSAGIWR